MVIACAGYSGSNPAVHLALAARPTAALCTHSMPLAASIAAHAATPSCTRPRFPASYSLQAPTARPGCLPQPAASGSLVAAARCNKEGLAGHSISDYIWRKRLTAMRLKRSAWKRTNLFVFFLTILGLTAGRRLLREPTGILPSRIHVSPSTPSSPLEWLIHPASCSPAA